MVTFGVVMVEIGDVVSLGSKVEMLDRNMMVMDVVNMLVTWSLVNSGWSGDISEWSVDNFVDWLWSYDEWGVVERLCMMDKWMMDCMVGIMVDIVVFVMVDIMVEIMDNWVVDIMVHKWMVDSMVAVAMSMMLDDWDSLVDDLLNWMIGHIWIMISVESLS